MKYNKPNHMRKDYLKPCVRYNGVFELSHSVLQTSGNIEGLSESDYDGIWTNDGE